MEIKETGNGTGKTKLTIWIKSYISLYMKRKKEEKSKEKREIKKKYKRKDNKMIEKAQRSTYYLLLFLYTLYYLMPMMNMTTQAVPVRTVIQLWMFLIITSLCMIQLLIFFYGFDSKFFFLGILLSFLFLLGVRRMDNNLYAITVELLLCLFAWKKDYKVMLRCMMTAYVIIMAVSCFGLLGFTNESPKPFRTLHGFSFGTVYPNTWGHMLFLVLMITWYLYLQKDLVTTFFLFWISGCFTYVAVRCKTAGVLMVLFPVVWCFSRKTDVRKRGIVLKCAVLAPLIALILTLLLCWQGERIHNLLNGHDFLYGLAMRFIQGGLAFSFNGFHLLGHRIEGMYQTGYGDVMLTVIDNPYVGYGIARGFMWLIACVLWWIASNIKCIIEKNMALLTISVFMAVVSMMEIHGLDVGWNIVLLYLFAEGMGLNAKKILYYDVVGKENDEIHQ